MPRETSGRRNRRRRRKNKERKTSAEDPSDQPKEESECTSELNSIETDECYVENRSIRDDKTTENHPSSSSTSVASTSRPFRPALVRFSIALSFFYCKQWIIEMVVWLRHPMCKASSNGLASVMIFLVFS